MYEMRKPELEKEGTVETILDVWEDSVRATHHFLCDQEIPGIRVQVAKCVTEVQHLIGAYDGDRLAAFAGIQDNRLEMLFVHSAYRGTGAGRLLLEHAIQNHDVRFLEVNRDNPQAVGFYEHMGFHIYRTAETDSQGNPYPILFMQRSQS